MLVLKTFEFDTIFVSRRSLKKNISVIINNKIISYLLELGYQVVHKIFVKISKNDCFYILIYRSIELFPAVGYVCSLFIIIKC